jgi:hypothetical protein
MAITHAYTSTKADPADATVIGAAKWGAAHLDSESVKTYGAVGNGTADDTVAVQAAITAAAAGSGRVFFPAGTYICSPLSIPSSITLQGVSGQGYYNAWTIPNANTMSCLKLKTGSTTALIVPDDTGTNKSTHVVCSDLAFDANGIAPPASASGICLDMADGSGPGAGRFWRFNRCYFLNGGGSAGYLVYIGSVNNGCQFTSCILYNNILIQAASCGGIRVYGSDSDLLDCWIGCFGNNYGVYFAGGNSYETNRISGGGVFWCLNGIGIAGRAVVIDGVSIDHNYNHGVYVGEDTDALTITNCYFHDNSLATTNTYSNIRFSTSNAKANILGNLNWYGAQSAAHPKYFVSVGASTGCVLNMHGNSSGNETWGTGFTDYAGTYTAPAFPASTVAAVNTSGAAVQAFITNGAAAITAVTLGSTVTGLTIAANGTACLRIASGQSVAFTYASGTPTWTWVIG